MTNYLDPVTARRLARERQVRSLAVLVGLLTIAIGLLALSIKVDRIDARLSDVAAARIRYYGVTRVTLQDGAVVVRFKPMEVKP
jgi:hypothetical protein